ncbi:Small G protein signaling modulator 1 RUN and TBC1 domain-containing protein 2 [Triplophysa tibetana]|uniref:Small G protein signaling modulator 1 RUN and TBC1 domain-containing protein 2 n=1 Tax=Triplophysa tibetana TaxID=1572043 RepID=A0A5A9N5H6_9TELE|nr:Small G protein signaling modulator 1 RUN and TBC1 domain-containing protein 2 [Triplophysa tibetana]
MEEAVTRKFVHEDSSHIFSFCGVVEACVLHGLKRRAAGFLRSNKLASLFMKVGKMFPPAEELCRKVHELEHIIENKQNQGQMSQESVRKQSGPPNLSPLAIKHLWIRTALTEKVLDKIFLYMVENSSKFYEREALLRDPVDGPILASLLVGPCALEYTKAKTANHFWTDPSADELVQRHRIHSGHCRQDSPTKRPALVRHKRQSSGSMDDRPSLWARDYVESLHQNSRATLLFGKNNVLVQPTDDMESIPGYLSLHQTADLMTLKWTPNQLMNGSTGELDYEKSVYWDYAMTIRLEEIVYLHCHQQVDSGGTVVLVSQDGIQRPPFRFPKGGHLLQFLTCLETGLLPHGQLDPPLWSQRGKGKVFPKLRNRSPHGSCESFSDKDEDEATDYVFRIIYPSSQEFGVHISHIVPVAPELMDQSVNLWQPVPRKSSCSSCSQNGSSDGGLPNGCNHDRLILILLCETMKHQIISRAFYGWLAYCRHLSTVRTHLSALVNPTIVEPDIPYDARGGLSAEVWKTFLQDSTAFEEEELLRLVYHGGVEPSLRKEVWPFLLGHYHFTMTLKERQEVDEQVRACYEQTMSEWLGCEAIVRQREKEQHAAALAKCASGASELRQDSTISTDSQSSLEKQSRACSQSDSNNSTQQVFGSVDEVDPIESEPKPKDEKPQPKIPNGTLPNCTSSPDSGHPSSRNFSVTSALSDSSPCTEETSAPESGPKTPREPPTAEPKSHIPSGSNPDKKQRENGSRAQDEAKDALISPTKKSEVELSKPQTSEAETQKAGSVEITKTSSEVCEDATGSHLKDIKGENQTEVEESTQPQEEKTKSEAEQGLVSQGKENQDAEVINTQSSLEDKDKPKALEEHGASGVEMQKSADGSELSSKATDLHASNITTPQSIDWESDRNRAKSIVKQLTGSESEGCCLLTSLSKQSPDMSDDSPSALQMEEISSSVVFMSSESHTSRVPLTLSRPMVTSGGRSMGMPALELCTDPGVNTSPEETESAISEEEPEMENLFPKPDSLAVTGEHKNDVASPVSSIGTTYSQELVDLYTLNLHRIDKDVQRCDRNYWYFTPANLEKLRNIMCSYVWQHLDIGYVQGMCDLLAPLLVILDDEAKAFSCFTELMKRMNQNFPHGGAMDTHFANMRSLIQILDSELFELMQQNGDYTHFYFCYRWFLLDFKREMVYDDVFSVWETIWAARYASSEHFVLFIALALVELYRDIILENNMDFTDIIKFFNEMAEHHDVPKVLVMARELVRKVQILIENK